MTVDATNKKALRGVVGFVGYLCMIALIVGVCLWNYSYLILETNDRTPVVLSRTLGEFSAEHAADPVPLVAILDSDTTRAFYKGQAFDYDAVLSTWYDFLYELGLEPQRVSDMRSLDAFDIVVAPYALCLSKGDTAHVKKYVAQGGSILMTGAVGSRDEKGAWLKYPLFGDIAGLRFAGNANPHPYDPASIDLVMEHPISLNWNTQTHLPMSPYEQLIVAYRAEERALPLATVAALPDVLSEDPLAAMCYGRYLDGRYTWAGFRLGAGREDDDTQRAFKELFSNTLAWLAGLPSVTTPRWPEQMQRSLALIVEVSSLESMDRTLRDATALNMPFTLAVPASLLEDLYPERVTLPAGSDAALVLDEAFLVEQSPDIHLWLPRLRERATQVLGPHVEGIFLRGEVTKHTGVTCLNAGFSYVMVDDNPGSSRHIEKLAEARPMGSLQKPLEIAKVPVHRGLPGGRSDSENRFCITGYDIPQFASWLKTNSEHTWLTTARDLAQWDMKRNRLRMAREFLPGSRLRVRVSNASYENMGSVPFTIDFYKNTEDVFIWPKAIGLAPPEATELNAHTWQFTVNHLAPGKTAEYVMSPLIYTKSKAEMSVGESLEKDLQFQVSENWL